VPFENSPVDRVAHPQGAPWEWGRRIDHPILLCPEQGSGAVIKLGEVVMILDLYRQGLTVSAIAPELGVDRKTVPQMHHPRPGAAGLWPT